MSIESVAAIRSQLWDAGFRPLAVINFDGGNEKTRGKAPIGADWGDRARKDPPDCLRFAPVPHALNTGILCDGLRAIDIDVDDADIAKRIKAMVLHRFGDAPIRIRNNSPRCLIVYRAAVGEPRKLVLSGTKGKVEALGKGQQFVAFGRHHTGAFLEWFPEPLGQESASSLPAISEHDLIDLLNTIAPLIDAKTINATEESERSSSEPEADPLRIASALAAIPNDGPSDWEAWNRIGMACWRATGGSPFGFSAFDAWSQRNPAYSATETRERWNHYPTSPPTSIGAGTIFHTAKEYAKEETPAPAAPPLKFRASEIAWDKYDKIKPREWIYAHFLIKKFVSVLGAPGGTGKTAYSFAVALSIVTGCDLLGETIHDPGKVWLYNLEDPEEELLRRLKAAMIHYGVTRKDVEHRLFLDSGRDRPLVIAETTRDGGIVALPVVKELIAEINARGIRVLIVDPFVRSHRLEENVNEQIDFAASLWGEVADQANCSVQLVHHFKKGGVSGDASAFRGASALIDAARSALSLAPMSEDEAKRLGVEPDERWQYVRVDNAKLNLAPPPNAATWLKLVGVDLDNASDWRPSDKVQTVERWEPPSAWDGMPMTMVCRILDKIDAGPEQGEFYAMAPQARDRWAGKVLMDDACKTDAQAKLILREWKENGVLEDGQYPSPRLNGRLTGCVRVNQAKVYEMRRVNSGKEQPDE